VIETLSIDWMRALAEALSVHFPEFGQQPYFAECFTNAVEERHAAEALAVTQSILDTRPELIEPTLRDAATIARALDGVWRHLDRIVRDAIGAAAPDIKRHSSRVGRLRAGSIDQHIRCGTITAAAYASVLPISPNGNVLDSDPRAGVVPSDASDHRPRTTTPTSGKRQGMTRGLATPR
jgi:hypothetical protein